MSDWNDGFKAGIEAAAKKLDEMAEAERVECRYSSGDSYAHAASLVRALKRPEPAPLPEQDRSNDPPPLY